MCVHEREREVKLGGLGAWQEKDVKGFLKGPINQLEHKGREVCPKDKGLHCPSGKKL